MRFSTVWNTIENDAWKTFFDTFNVLQTYYFVIHLKQLFAFEVQIWYHAQKLGIITVSRFSHFMFISSSSYIIVSVYMKVCWCVESDRKESNAEWETPPSISTTTLSWIHNSLYRDLTRSTHPPSFSRHLIKALSGSAQPDIWENET